MNAACLFHRTVEMREPLTRREINIGDLHMSLGPNPVQSIWFASVQKPMSFGLDTFGPDPMVESTMFKPKSREFARKASKPSSIGLGSKVKNFGSSM
jgi:hypothetical protein